MRTCDMFCRVIDNYGDAGVAWRLALMLAKEYNWAVRLIIDDAAVLSAIVPTAQTKATPAVPGQVVVSDWLDDSTDTPFASWSGQAADVVIELFSCRLPDVYEAAIAKRVESSPCAVFALDYLTAEKYAEEGNGLPSPHPRYGYDKTFLFPGFSDKTCGINRERDLLQKFSGERRSSVRPRLFASFGADPSHPFTLYFFTYPEMPVEGFANLLAQDPRPVQVLAAPGLASARLKQALVHLQARHISFVQAPMVAQDIFDDVLLSCDAALIRGEDSVLRAQLAGIPMIWTLYPQQEDTHLTKLAAFASLYAQSLPQTARRAWLEIEDYVNNGQVHEDVWKKWRDCFAALQSGATDWKKTLFSLPTLAESISKLAEKKLKF